MKQILLFPELFGEDENFININMNAEPSQEDLSLLLLAFMRRTVMDASGPKTVDAWCTEEDQSSAREYLTNGYIKREGYHYYDESFIKHTPKRNHESLCEKYQPTPGEYHYSPIPLSHILDYMDLDHNAFNSYINKWKDNNWSRDTDWYKNFIDNSRFLES